MDVKLNQPNAEVLLQQTETVRLWVTSSEGQNAIAASLQKAQSLTEQFREAQRVDPETLHKPTTL